MPPQPSTAKPDAGNRILFGCMIVFALPFAAGGLLALVLGIYAYPTSPNAIVAIIMGGVFTIGGLAVMIAGWYGRKASAKREALQLQHPGKPWMWRDDWARGAIKDWNKGRAIAIWVVTVIWNAIAFPVAFASSPDLPKGKLMLIFPLIGIILLIGAIYQTLQMMKFGTSTCHLERVPIAPGSTFRGDIELNTDAAPQNGYRLRIASIHAVTTRSKYRSTGSGGSTIEKLLWDQEVVVEASAAMRSPAGTRVPFKFTTPADAHVTDESNPFDRYLWRVSASAKFPGVDYAAQFEVPVFKSGE